MTAATSDQLRAAVDALRTACLPSQDPQPLYFGEDDRYYLAQLASFSVSYTEGQTFGLLALLSIGFRAFQPDSYSTTPETIHFTIGGSPWTLDPDAGAVGDAPTLPAWTITIGAAGTGPLTLTNSTTGETCTLTGAGGNFNAGDSLVLTRDGYTVTLNGTASFGVLNGRIPRLVPGSNTINLTAGGTATVSAFSATYTPRFY